MIDLAGVSRARGRRGGVAAAAASLEHAAADRGLESGGPVNAGLHAAGDRRVGGVAARRPGRRRHTPASGHDEPGRADPGSGGVGRSQSGRAVRPAEAGDFVHALAFRYGTDRLLERAAALDAGFDKLVFADMLDALARFTDEEIRGPAEQAAGVREFAADWAARLRAGQDRA